MAAGAHTAVLSDSTGVELKEVKVTARGGRMARIDRTGAVTFGRDALAHGPRVLGEADALRYMQLMPGVSVASDYASGASIDGMGYGQNEYRLNGVPVHFPYHFGGIFSVFHPRMYEQTRVGKSIHAAGGSDVTGGTVDVSGQGEVADRAEGEVNVGMIASSGYLRMPVGKRVSAAVSGRVSYLDALYGGMLDDGHMRASYGLCDLDVAVTGEISDADRVRGTFHYNGDHLDYDDHDFSLLTGLRWSNLLGGADWRHDGERLWTEQGVWGSRFANDLVLDMNAVRLKAPTAISEVGMRGVFGMDGVAERVDVRWGYGARHCTVTPQRVEMTGFGNDGGRKGGNENVTAAKVWGEAVIRIGRRWRLTGGLEGAMVMGADGYRSRWADPRFTAMLGWDGGNVTLHAGSYHQWLHQVGFSEMGMSSNFKLGPSDKAPVERGLNVAVAWSHRVAEWLSVNADGFYKRISDEPEYLGAVLDIVDADYRAEDYVRVTSGYNAGGSVSARFERDGVSATAAYGYCVGKRRFDGGGSFDATGVLRHTATLSAGWRIDSHWNVSGVMKVASGRPYTPVKAVYFIGERLMMEYGARNSARLPLYHRLDLGADYEFHTGKLTHRVNVSVVNVYGQRNVEMSTFTVDMESGRYVRREVNSLLRWLPSLSYTVLF